MLSQASQDHLPLPFPGCRWRRCKHHPTPPSMGRHGSLACGRQCEARCIGHPLSLLERLLLLALSLWLPQHHNCLKKSLSVGWLVECCLFEKVTVSWLVGWVLLYVHRNHRLIRDGSPGWPHSSWALVTVSSQLPILYPFLSSLAVFTQVFSSVPLDLQFDEKDRSKQFSVHWSACAVFIHTKCGLLPILIITYIYHVLINALSAHMIHINLNMIFYTHVEYSPTKTDNLHKVLYGKNKQKQAPHTHTHTHTHTHIHLLCGKAETCWPHHKNMLAYTNYLKTTVAVIHMPKYCWWPI